MTRVLIVDDDPVQLRLTAEVARRADFVPVTATGGRQALDMLRADPGIGVMVLDLVMPELDGMAVLERLAQLEARPPVVVQTAHGSIETVISAMRAGAIDFVVKPVGAERLQVSLTNALR
ncbi:MAG: response regulator, partial [Devosia sp.]